MIFFNCQSLLKQAGGVSAVEAFEEQAAVPDLVVRIFGLDLDQRFENLASFFILMGAPEGFGLLEGLSGGGGSQQDQEVSSHWSNSACVLANCSSNAPNCRL